MILEMGSWDVILIVDVQAASVRLHRMAGDAEAGLFGALNVGVHSAADTERGKNEQGHECEDFACRTGRRCGMDQKKEC